MNTLISKYKRVDPLDWAERHIVLDYGKFKRVNHPLIVEPLRAMCQMKGGVVGLLGSVQHIKTLTAQIGHLYLNAVCPSRAGIYDLTEDALRAFSDDKFTPLVSSTKAITNFIPSDVTKRTKLYFATHYGLMRLLSANIKANRNSKTFERVSCDESWTYDESWLTQIKGRMASFPWSWMMFLPSSGQTEGSELDRLWKDSTQKVWHVPCDHCGVMSPYHFTMPRTGNEIPSGGMKWASKEDYITDGVIDRKALHGSIHYECPMCSGKTIYTASGVHKRNLKGCYLSLNPSGNPKLDFYHYNALAHMPWPDLVDEWLSAKRQADRGDLTTLEDFIRKRLASAWSDSAFIKAQEKGVESAGSYLLGDKWDLPAQVPSLTFCTVDVQKDHFWYVIRQWANVNNTLYSRLLDRGRAVSTTQIKEVCDKYKVLQNGFHGCQVALDGNYNTNQVQRMAYENGWMVFRGVDAKDFDHKGIRRLFDEPKFIDTLEGYAVGKNRYIAQYNFSKNSALNRLALIRSIKDDKGDSVWTHAANAGDVYIRHISAWVKITKEKADGEVYYDWINRDQHHDHMGDCEVMQVVFAAMGNLMT